MTRRTFVCGKVDAVSMLVLTLPAAFVSSFRKGKCTLINKIITCFCLFNYHLHITGCLFAMNIATGNAALSDVATPCSRCCLLFHGNRSHCLVFTIVSLRSRATEKNWVGGKKKHN